MNTNFQKYFPSINVHLIFTNKSTIGSFFPHKDKLPSEMRFSLIYEFTCTPWTYWYIGSASRNLYLRVSKHSGKSYCEGRMLSSPPFSLIGEHWLAGETSVVNSNFKILDHASSDFKLRILESLYTYKRKPKLNDMS